MLVIRMLEEYIILLRKNFFIKSKYHVEKNDKNKKVWKDEVVCTKDIINIIEVLPGKKSYIFFKIFI